VRLGQHALQSAVAMPHEGSGSVKDDRRCSMSVVTSASDATRFSLGRLLGKGAYSRVYEAFDAKRGERLAIKIISKKDLAKDDALKKLRSEIETHQSSVHESIVRFHSSFDDAKNHYVLTEL
jgi:serine/threonine protein kinase